MSKKTVNPNLVREDSVADGAIGQNEELVGNLTDFIMHNPVLQKQASPIQKVLMKRMLKQTYDPDMARKFWMNLVDLGVKTYQQDFEESTPALTKTIRVQVAARLAKDFEHKVNTGALRAQDVLGPSPVTELVGSGVGVGVLNQAKPEETGGGEEGEPGKEPTSIGGAEQEEKPEATTKESIIRKTSTMKISSKALHELVNGLVVKALKESQEMGNGPEAGETWRDKRAFHPGLRPTEEELPPMNSVGLYNDVQLLLKTGGTGIGKMQDLVNILHKNGFSSDAVGAHEAEAVYYDQQRKQGKEYTPEFGRLINPLLGMRESGRSMMKIKKTELQEMVKGLVQRKLHELADRDSVPGKDGELGKFAGKCDKFLSDSIDEINDLVKEAEEQMRENLLNHPTVGERNRALMARVGILKNLKAKMLEMLEATHRNL